MPGAARRTSSSRPHAALLLVFAVLVAGVSACGTGSEAPALRVPPSAGAVATRAGDPPRVLIFGDSIAAQQGGPAAVALRQAGVETEVFALWGEGMFSRDQYDMGATAPDPPPATLLYEASARIAEFRPDAVAVYANHNYWPPYPRDAGGATIERGSEAFTAMARAQLTELVRRLSVGGASIHLVSPIPEGSDGDTAATNPMWSSYLSLQSELGFSVIDSGAVLAGPDGTRVEEVPDCRGAPALVRPPQDIHLTYYGAGLMANVTAAALAAAVGVEAPGLGAPAQAPVALLPFGAGYRIVTCDGAGFRFAVGGDALLGLEAGGRRAPGDPVVGAAPSATGGAWLVTAAGVVAPLDGAPQVGDVTVPAGDRVVAVAATPSGHGFWAATAGGVVAPMGDAVVDGDLAGTLAGGESVVSITAGAGPAATGGAASDAAVGPQARNDGAATGTAGGGAEPGPGGVAGGASAPATNGSEAGRSASGAAGEAQSGGAAGGAGDGSGSGGALGGASAGTAGDGDGSGGASGGGADDVRTDGTAGEAPDGAETDEAGTGASGTAGGTDDEDGGYRLATSAGRVVAFGGAGEAGDLAAAPPAGGVVAMAVQPGGEGYWLLDRAGTPHAFGGAPDLGSAAGQPLVRLSRFASTSDFDTVAVAPEEAPTEATALLPTASGEGYWVLLANGAVCSFGDAHPWGGIHRAEVDEIMIYKDQPYYAEGPCRQDVGFGPPNTSPAA